ncbi:MAG: Na/Pi cotransporter family protein [Bacteroidales bacterium]|jgi:phosphate:Na+ symporter|nr:Na/Pi cotransporter family protein [Bacteroidales bacterium]
MDILLTVLGLLGALGMFLYGMTIMSDSLQKIAGDKLRVLLTKMTSNRFRGILTGIGITSVIQASAATIVMVVSFVNAGLISLPGAISIIMGANIGTTVTAWIVSLLGFKVSIVAFSLPLIAIATPLMFTKKYKVLGTFIIGFSLLFYGLGLLQAQVPDFTQPQYASVLEVVGKLSNYGYGSILLFVLIGTIVTVVIQSSSAMMAVTLVMCSKGLISFEMACVLCLGENIGTTITANIAAIVANKTAKRAARAHTLFNITGVIWILILFKPVIYLLSHFVMALGGTNPLIPTAASIPIALSCFHSFFNIANTAILVWFIPTIIKILNKMVPEGDDEEEFRLKYINNGLISSGEIALEPAKKEIEVFSRRVVRMFEFIPELLVLKNDKEFNALTERTKKYEEITDRMEVEIAGYLTKVAENGLSKSGSMQVESMLRIVDNLESIGDSCYQLSLSIESKNKQHVWFSQHLRDNIFQMFDLIRAALAEMNDNLSENYLMVKGQRAEEIENNINNFRDKLREEHTEAIKNNEYSYQTGIVYSNFYAQLEKLADFAINVTQAITKRQ